MGSRSSIFTFSFSFSRSFSLSRLPFFFSFLPLSESCRAVRAKARPPEKSEGRTSELLSLGSEFACHSWSQGEKA
jgi:hypothetical protein